MNLIDLTDNLIIEDGINYIHQLPVYHLHIGMKLISSPLFLNESFTLKKFDSSLLILILFY